MSELTRSGRWDCDDGGALLPLERVARIPASSELTRSGRWDCDMSLGLTREPVTARRTSELTRSGRWDCDSALRRCGDVGRSSGSCRN